MSDSTPVSRTTSRHAALNLKILFLSPLRETYQTWGDFSRTRATLKPEIRSERATRNGQVLADGTACPVTPSRDSSVEYLLHQANRLQEDITETVGPFLGNAIDSPFKVGHVSPQSACQVLDSGQDFAPSLLDGQDVSQHGINESDLIKVERLLNGSWGVEDQEVEVDVAGGAPGSRLSFAHSLPSWE